ncbi:hypothetical protein ACFWA9_14840 [Kitasatospora sp. NPDC059973]|uniref:hypothetical protein n=1 Tax=Kitasatospora sp. NPDC059973 TaxID=3347020 RepID=UPI003681856D
MSEQRRSVLRYTWRGSERVATKVVAYGVEGEPLPGRPGVPPWEAVGGRTTDRVRLTVTDDEVRRWQDALAAYVRAVDSASARLREVWAKVSRRGALRRVPGARRRGAVRLGRAEEVYTADLAAATRAYRPVRQEVEARVAVAREEERAVRARERDRAEAARLAHIAALRQWKQRWTDLARAADLRTWTWRYEGQALLVLPQDAGRPGQPALTAREVAKLLVVLAGRGCTRVEWEREARRSVEEIVGPGQFPAWWRDVLSATVNTRPREAAEQEITSTAERLGAALDTAGRPGMRVFTVGSQQSVSGWHLALDRPPRLARPGVELPVVPSEPANRGWILWNYDGRVLPYDTLTLTLDRWRRDPVGFAEVRKETIYSTFTRSVWYRRTPAQFARSFLDDEARHYSPWHENDLSFRLADHADAREFVPYVMALAGMVTSALLAVAQHHGVAL